MSIRFNRIHFHLIQWLATQLILLILISINGCAGQKSRLVLLDQISAPIVKDKNTNTHHLATPDGDIVVTVLKSCDRSLMRRDSQSSFRQLMAGFRQVRMSPVITDRLDGVTVDKTSVSCNLEQRNLNLAMFLLHTKPCLIEVIGWHPEGKQLSEATYSDLKHLVQLIIKNENKE